MNPEQLQSRATRTRLPDVTHDVLVFAEHLPSRAELDQVVAEVADHEDAVVTFVLHHNPVPTQTRVLEHGGVVHDHLDEAMELLRATGAHATAELVSGDVEHALLTEIRLRTPDAIILLPGRHLVAHLVHRDLERKLRHHTSVPILAIPEHGAAHLV